MSIKELMELTQNISNHASGGNGTDGITSQQVAAMLQKSPHDRATRAQDPKHTSKDDVGTTELARVEIEYLRKTHHLTLHAARRQQRRNMRRDFATHKFVPLTGQDGVQDDEDEHYRFKKKRNKSRFCFEDGSVVRESLLQESDSDDHSRQKRMCRLESLEQEDLDDDKPIPRHSPPRIIQRNERFKLLKEDSDSDDKICEHGPPKLRFKQYNKVRPH